MSQKLRPPTDAEEVRIQAGIAADPDNPEWTEEDFANARPAIEIIPEIVAAAQKRRGRPPGQTKEHVNLRIDHDVMQKLRATGPGWQGRVNEALRKLVQA